MIHSGSHSWLEEDWKPNPSLLSSGATLSHYSKSLICFIYFYIREQASNTHVRACAHRHTHTRPQWRELKLISLQFSGKVDHIIPFLKPLQFALRIKLKLFTAWETGLNLGPAHPSNPLPYNALLCSLLSRHSDLSCPPRHTHVVPASGPLLGLWPLPGTLMY